MKMGTVPRHDTRKGSKYNDLIFLLDKETQKSTVRKDSYF